MGGIISSYSFLDKDAPEFRMGYLICIGFQCMAGLAACMYYAAVVIENRRQVSDSRGRVTEGKQVEARVPFRYYT